MNVGGKNLLRRLLCLYPVLLLTTACAPSLQTNSLSSVLSQSEPAYCGSAQSINYPGVTTSVSGNASFYYRAPNWTGPVCTGLCGDPVSLGIPYAEVHIVNAAGRIIQCGETNSSGNFSLSVPMNPGSYTLQVWSRSLTNMAKVSVLEDIYLNQPYIVSTGFSISTGIQISVSGLSVTASARSSDSGGVIPGGAFNILADIYWANQFLRANSGNSGFVADKLTTYWKAGFNPNSYFGSPNALSSFYLAAQDQLYILGGSNGDVQSSDTDHFDDSIILHEYAHFLEAHNGHSDSPGGSHNGNFILDPRLAWSEGWADYFQAAVLNKVIYASSGGPKGNSGFTNFLDTIGFKDDSVEGSGEGAGIATIRSLNEAAATAAYDQPGPDEGLFREYSVGRTLFKTLTNSGGLPFAPIWAVFTGFHSYQSTQSPPLRFVNFGLFNEVLQSLLNTSTYSSLSTTTWNNTLTEENQVKTTALYGDTLNTQTPGTGATVCPTKNLVPVADATYVFPRSNQLWSNAFYTYYHDGTSKKISFHASLTGNILDLDLYLYQNGYAYSEEYQETLTTYSNPTVAAVSKSINVSSNTEIETVDLTGMPAGYYMINVKASTLNKTAAGLSGSSAAFYLYIGDQSTVVTCLVPN